MINTDLELQMSDPTKYIFPRARVGGGELDNYFFDEWKRSCDTLLYSQGSMSEIMTQIFGRQQRGETDVGHEHVDYSSTSRRRQ